MGKTRRLQKSDKSPRSNRNLVVDRVPTTNVPKSGDLFVRPFVTASTLEKSNVMGVLLTAKVTRITDRLAYVCTGCGSIGEMKEGATANDRDVFLTHFDVSCCGIVYTFKGGI